MDRLALTGLALATAGATGLLTVELIATAQAGRPQEQAYLAAFSSGSALRLLPRNPAPAVAMQGPMANPIRARALVCARVVEVSTVALGLRCHGG